MKEHLQKMVAAAAEHRPDGLMFGGAAAISYGASLVYFPAGFIVGGLFLLAAGFLSAKAGQ